VAPANKSLEALARQAVTLARASQPAPAPGWLAACWGSKASAAFGQASSMGA